jgi:hypothetical protein
MGKLIDLTGQKFGRLTVIKIAGKNKHRKILWACKCDCGNEKVIVGSKLLSGHTKSCGCLVLKVKDLVGKIFGKLTVVKYVGNQKWLCKCSCGNEKIVKSKSLKSKRTKSCGCITRLDNLVNQRFGKLIVIKRAKNDLNGFTKWVCKCDCGNEPTVIAHSLKTGVTKSCGCISRQKGIYHFNYNHNKSDKERLAERSTSENKQWRTSIFARDKYTCCICKNNKGKNLNAHHLNSWANFPEDRYNLYNGITLCEICHKNYHKKYGRNHATFAKFAQYYKEYKKI